MKTKTVLEISREGRHYHFICENNSPLGEVYDVLFEMLQNISCRLSEIIHKVEKPIQTGSGDIPEPQNNEEK